MEWYIYGLLGVFTLSIMLLIFKKLILMGLNNTVLLLLIFGIVFLFYAGHMLITKTPFKVSYPMLILVLIAAILSYLANIFYLKSISLAPNVGYATAVQSFQVALVTIGAILIFKQPLTKMKLAGVLLSLAGIVLLTL